MTTSESAAVPFRIADHVLGASPYIPEWLDLDRSAFIRLDRNENTAPLPASVRDALVRGVDGVAAQSYPEPGPLQPLIADYVGVPPEYVLATNGSDQGIDLTVRLALPPGGSMAVARPEFAVFHHVADAVGGRILGVPYGPDFEFPYAEFSAAVRAERPDLITLINPNNPTGTAIDIDYVESVIADHPDIAVIVDEAYYEYTGHTVAGLTTRYPNLMVLRTFSKAFAMAGLRLGYVVAAPEIIGHLRKLQNPFDVNQLAIVAGAAQLARVEEMEREVAHAVRVVKPYVVRALTEIGVPVWPGSANFLLVRPDDCAAAVAYLHDAGILVRSMSAPGLRGLFRVSLGSLEEMRKFVEVFRTYVQGDSVQNRPEEVER
ncbi:pyridoxal phosphate-dependent aminotransferase [Nocardia bovistercoris]|uniref:histidinol-phosphate transaminase n=1 Tax=Nocardia bovistercoris TaxID=2785916 RepID=A0A931IF68_9NOCA|nr:histidinol-phosphate transaminase [Nocardia bovistercoris]MBH0778967.1 histidinol-phosphate aminotransferase family protein [Nocardia bovistercoris]